MGWDGEFLEEASAINCESGFLLEEELNEVASLLRSVGLGYAESTWSSIPKATFVVDSMGCVVSWSPAAVEFFGYQASDLLGRHYSCLQASTDGNQPASTPPNVTAAGHSANQVWLARKDGSTLWANLVLKSVTDDRGRLQGFAAVIRETTDTYVDTYTTCVVFGEDDRIVSANKTFLHLTGYPPDHFERNKQTWSDLMVATPSACAAAVIHEELLLHGSSAPFRGQLRLHGGGHIAVSIATILLQLCPYRWTSVVTPVDPGVDSAPKALPPRDEPVEFAHIVGRSEPLRQVLRQVEMVAASDATVLILGETGTGKELIARAIHDVSNRRMQPFVSLNCAAIPTGLLESELFGYERGAFTGALGQKVGRFEMAHRGTLFLDEVGDIPLELQPKLLRALQEKSFERLGGTRTIPIDIRLVAATNRNLTKMMGENQFRSDLYYRLRVFPISLPPLRDHADDIPLLVWHFVAKFAARMNRTIEHIPKETLQALVKWPWPGNVRELENFIERSVILSSGNCLQAPLSEFATGAPDQMGSLLLENVEREHVLHVLRETRGVISAAANRLGIPRTTLNAMMKRLGVTRRDL